MTQLLKRSMQALCLSALFGLGACSSADTDSAQTMTTEQVRTQQLGESTQPVWFSGEGAGLLPSYDERVALHFYNRIRIAPQNWPFIDQMSGNRLLLPAHSAALYQPFMAEAGRWQAQHGIDTGCDCTAENVGYDPMDPTTSEQEQYINATCCEMGIEDGVAKCVSPLVACTDPRATLRGDRWALLNQGAAAIDTEQIFTNMQPLPTGLQLVAGYIQLNQDGSAAVLGGLAGNATGRKINAIGLSMSEGSITPPECIEGKENPCGTGTCQDKDSGATTCDKQTNAMCLGLCAGGEKDGNPCVLPEDTGTPEECKPENFPKVSQIALLTGNTIQPSPTLSDGIHYQMPEMIAAFEPTPMDNITFAVHFYERTGDPIGTASEMKVVAKGTCIDLTAVPNEPNMADGNPANFAGVTYKGDQPTAGMNDCIPYVFVAKDAAGFEYTYPEYGSLQANLNDLGIVVRNDDTCPIWTPTRVDLSCASDADECEDGEKRACYTGRAGTQEKGICKIGEETCKNGRWTGQCDGEVTPESAEVCGDQKDNDCNGGVDEGCQDDQNPDMGGTPDMGGDPDMGSSDDMGGVVITPPEGGDEEDDGCGCRSVNTGKKTPSWPILALGALSSLIFFRRRRA